MDITVGPHPPSAGPYSSACPETWCVRGTATCVLLRLEPRPVSSVLMQLRSLSVAPSTRGVFEERKGRGGGG